MNWLAQRSARRPQDATTTEDGAYTITPAGIATNSIMRNPDARFALPTEDEWYKAAYYDVGQQLPRYPAGARRPVSLRSARRDAEHRELRRAVGDTRTCGSYPRSASPNGTFDQGGNVWEWTESISGTA